MELLDILLELASDRDGAHVEAVAINGGVVELFQYFMVSAITPQRKAGQEGLQTKAYGAVQSLAPVSTSTLLKLEKWVKVVMAAMGEKGVREYVGKHLQDMVDYALLVVCKSDTMLKQMSAEQKASSKLLVIQTKLDMMDLLCTLSDFDWCRHKINSQADYFEALYQDLPAHIKTVSTLAKLYFLLANLLLSDSYAHHDGLIRDSLLRLTEWLVFPQLIHNDAQIHALLKQAIDLNYTRFDLALAKCYFSITQNPNALSHLLDELATRSSDVLVRFLIFLSDRKNTPAILYQASCLHELLITQQYTLDPMKDYHLAYSIQVGTQLDKRLFLVFYRLIKFLSAENQKILSYCCFVMKNKELEPVLERPYDDYDLIEAFQDLVNPEPKALYYSQMDDQNSKMIVMDD